MIDFENNEKNKIFNMNVIQTIISIIIAILITYIIINFIPFSDMLDNFKVSFKEATLSKVMKYYAFTLTIIVIPIYTILYFIIRSLIKIMYEKVKSKRDE